MSETRPDTTLQVVDGDHTRGIHGAPATILVYGDYECPYTRALELSLTRLRHLHAEAFRSGYRYFPLREIHPHAQTAAEAAEAVYVLRGADAFWVMHDGLFAHQDRLDGMPYVFINGERYRGALDVTSLREAMAGMPGRATRSAH